MALRVWLLLLSMTVSGAVRDVARASECCIPFCRQIRLRCVYVPHLPGGDALSFRLQSQPPDGSSSPPGSIWELFLLSLPETLVNILSYLVGRLYRAYFPGSLKRS